MLPVQNKYFTNLNSKKAEYNAICEFKGLYNIFSQIIISSEVNVSKPNKKIFEIACEKTNSKPEECIMVGDKYGTDIEEALNAGLKAIWVDRKNETRDYKYKIKELREMRKFIEI